MEHNSNHESEKVNPNSIGELLNISRDLETFPDKVYRSVLGRAAIDDLLLCGVVRNKQSAGLVDKSRWNELVFWSKGSDGKYHVVQADGYVIVAPQQVAESRTVTLDDIEAIYIKNEAGEVVNVLGELLEGE